MIDYAAAGDLLEAWRHALETFDGDGWVAIFTDDAEYHDDPFGVPLAGHNALRAWMLDASASRRDVEFTVERHWVSGATVLAAWRSTFIRRANGRRVRVAGFMTAEVATDGRIARYREWTQDGPDEHD
jgi:ketosteroid isomerase-like protein